MRLLATLASLLAVFRLAILGVRGQQSQQSFTPAWVPLAVRSPHLNTWVWKSSEITNHWPGFGLDTDVSGTLAESGIQLTALCRKSSHGHSSSKSTASTTAF